MVEIGSRYLETLKDIVMDVERDYTREGNGKHFLDFYHEWRQRKIFPAWFFAGDACYHCLRHIDDERIIITRAEAELSISTYYFHPACFDNLVIKHHIANTEG
jgi:hypothetical protein